MSRIQLIVWSLCLLGSLSLRADDLSFNPKISLPITGLAFTTTGLMGAFEDDLDRKSCLWCSTNSMDSSIRNQVRWSRSHLANKLSHVSAFVLTPLSSFSLLALRAHHDDQWGRFWIDTAIIAEAVSIAQMTESLVQITVGRERPNAHFSSMPKKPSQNSSFYSGHTSFAFALASASGTVASMRGYKEAPYIWASGLALASVSAYLRLAADRHYFTDVLAGAVMGAGIGFAIPYFFHSNENSRWSFQIMPAARGITLMSSWTWS